MKTDFTFGIPDIDHLTGSQIESPSFFLFTGNDDEGMRFFLAEIEKSQERHAQKEQDRWQFIRADLRDQNLPDKIAGGFAADPTDQDTERPNVIFVIENLSDFSMEEIENIMSLPRKTVWPEQKIIFAAMLFDGIFPPSFENRLKHLADSHFQFEMIKKYTDFERILSVWKYKNGSLGGKIFRYVLLDGRFLIENKKRIY